MTHKYSIAYIDPPWDYDGRVQHGGSEQGYTSGALAFYPTMKPQELREWCDTTVRPALAEKAIIFMWVTGPQLAIAADLWKYMGAKYKTVAFVWDKMRVNPGYYTMSQTEFVLVGTKGGIPKPRGARNVRQILHETRTHHSAKPVEIRNRIDEMFPDPSLKRIEYFARSNPPSATQGVTWDTWGNEAPTE